MAGGKPGLRLQQFNAPPMSAVTAAPVAGGFRSDLVRWQHLVSVDWLAALLAHAQVAAPPEADWHLVEVACDGLDAYLHSHIPGARYLDTRQFEQPPFWNKVADGVVRQCLREAGFGPHSTLILYGRNPLAAARLAHLALYAGVKDVRLLDGGLDAWSAACNPTQTGAQALFAPGNAPAPFFSKRTDFLVDTAQAKALLNRADGALVSIRSRAEFMGETSGYSYIVACGEIAGARWGHAGRDGDVNSMSNFQDALGRMKPAAEIAALWREAGIGPEMHIAFYCGTGWRASLAFFYAWLMGWERIGVYDGGWFEWSSDATNPVICRTAVPPSLG